MMKMAVVENKRSGLFWFSFVDEFSRKSYNGKTFQTMAEAVDFANEKIVYCGKPFDLISINKPEYIVVDSLNI